jgi:hypothetical protein
MSRKGALICHALRPQPCNTRLSGISRKGWRRSFILSPLPKSINEIAPGSTDAFLTRKAAATSDEWHSSNPIIDWSGLGHWIKPCRRIMDCTQNGPFSSLNRTYRGISGVGIRCACQSSGAAPCGLGGKSDLGDRRGAAVKNGAIAICHGRYGCWAGDHDDALVALPASSRGGCGLICSDRRAIWGLALEFFAIPRWGKLLDAFSYRLVIQQYDWKQIPASS